MEFFSELPQLLQCFFPVNEAHSSSYPAKFENIKKIISVKEKEITSYEIIVFEARRRRKKKTMRGFQGMLGRS